MPSARIRIEVAVETPDDAIAAGQGGADRLELCAALDLGGLTPTLGTYEEVRAVSRLPVLVMLRPRSGDFVYTDAEVRVMTRDLECFRPLQPDGFVFGLLRTDGRVDAERAADLVRRASGIPCVFHRAFDRTPDLYEALEVIVRLGFARILTSGREATGLAGAPVMAGVQVAAGGRIEVLPCGKIRAASAMEVIRMTGCDQVHGSFAETVPDEAGRGYRGYVPRSRTSAEQVAATRVALDAFLPEVPARVQ